MTSHQKVLTIYDMSRDGRRPATQADIDQMQEILMKLAVSRGAYEDAPRPVDGFTFKLKRHPNPMRTDGVFVAEDKAIEPYHSGVRGVHGELLYPAMPNTPWRINCQLPDAFATELCWRWNQFVKDEA